MDVVQITIIVVSLILTILFVILGIQVFYILKEIRRNLQKINKMFDDFGRVTGVVGDTAEGLSGFVSGIKTGLKFVSNLRLKGEDGE